MGAGGGGMCGHQLYIFRDTSAGFFAASLRNIQRTTAVDGIPTAPSEEPSTEVKLKTKVNTEDVHMALAYQEPGKDHNGNGIPQKKEDRDSQCSSSIQPSEPTQPVQEHPVIKTSQVWQGIYMYAIGYHD